MITDKTKLHLCEVCQQPVSGNAKRRFCGQACQKRAYRKSRKESGNRIKGGRDYSRERGIKDNRPKPYRGLDKVNPLFVGLDGESIEVPGKADKFVLLAASDGSEIENWKDGLSTLECFKYLFDLSARLVGKTKNRAPRTRFLWFGSNYDINMILKDIPKEVLEKLWTTNNARWYYAQGFKRFVGIRWIPGKMFSISHKIGELVEKDGKLKFDYKQVGSFASYDVFGFAQYGFVKAAQGWRILSTDENNQDVKFLNEMKSLRGHFSQLARTQKGREKLKRYNRLEVDILASMGKKIWETHKNMGLNLGSMHGAGATAALLLDKYNVATHIKNTMPQEVQDHVMRAYFGGRVHLHRSGRFNQVYAYDIRSAYPWAASKLPSLKDSRWYKVKDFNPDLWGIWHVKWDCTPIKYLDPPERHRVFPFPFRTEKGSISWGEQGEGWYWTPEVEIALRHFPYMMEVLKGEVLHLPNEDEKPFDFFNELYDERARIKSNDPTDLRQMIIKLGMNASYGKLAQSANEYGGELHTPRFQSYIYAGLITALTRSRMLDAGMKNPRNIIGFATDCVFSRIDLNLKLTNDLGGWEVTQGYNAIFIQPGFYAIRNEKGKWSKTHTRGFLASEIDWDFIDKELDNLRNYYKFEFGSRRFIGLGLSLMNNTGWPGDWRTWIEAKRKLLRFHVGQIPFPGYPNTDREKAAHQSNNIVGSFSHGGVSLPYIPKHEWKTGEESYLNLSENMSQPERFD